MNFFKRNRKINFEKEKLVLCRIGLVTDYKILEYGTSYTSWDYKAKTTWQSFPEIRILVKTRFGFYYEPEDFLGLYRDKHYNKGYENVEVGEKFVEKTNDLPIQYFKDIVLTKRELRTKKISLKRIKELENLLNSKWSLKLSHGTY